MPGVPAAGPVGPLADRLLKRAWRRVEKRGGAITPESPAEALHDLRKRCKELRYLLEFFAGLYDAGAHGEIVAELKKLQSNLEPAAYRRRRCCRWAGWRSSWNAGRRSAARSSATAGHASTGRTTGGCSWTW